jgi:uncharacterized protein (TIGR00369 family)
VEITDKQARARMVVDERHLHPGGKVHGGAWVALTDSVAAWATYRNLPDGWDFTTIEMKLNVFASAGPGDELEAVATPLHVGRSTVVLEVPVTRGDRRVAHLVVTQFVIPPG